MNTLNKTEEEKMLQEVAELAYRKKDANKQLDWGLPENLGATAVARANFRDGYVYGYQAANTQHSKILEDYDRIARVAEKQAVEIKCLTTDYNLMHNKCFDAETKLSAANATIAMLHDAGKKLIDRMRPSTAWAKSKPITHSERDYVEMLHLFTGSGITQAAADAFMAEHDAKVLEDIADGIADFQSPRQCINDIRAKATELRASANRKDE